MSAISASPLYLIAAAAAAGYCIIGLQVKNGYWDQLNALTEAHPTQLPGSGVDGTLLSSITGIAPLDAHLAALLRFFWPLTTGEHPPASLFAFWTAGQVLACHALIVLEGLRAGNRGKFLAYTTLWGMLYQTVPFGIIIPIWVALWLWTSPIARYSAATPSPTLTSALIIDDADLAALPHSLIWGYILPTLLAGLPSPMVVTVEQQQAFLYTWQIFPVLVATAHLVFSTAARRLRSSPAAATPAEQKAALTQRLRWVYIFVLLGTAATHALTVLFMLYPALRPALLAPADPSGLDLMSVFSPASTPFKVEHARSLAEGALNLLQYDVYFGAGALFYWASQLYWASTSAPSLSSILVVLAGPAGAAVVLVWRRDEHMLLGNAPKEKKY